MMYNHIVNDGYTYMARDVFPVDLMLVMAYDLRWNFKSTTNVAFVAHDKWEIVITNLLPPAPMLLAMIREFEPVADTEKEVIQLRNLYYVDGYNKYRWKAGYSERTQTIYVGKTADGHFCETESSKDLYKQYR